MHSFINIFSFELPNSRLGFLNKLKRQKKIMTELGGKWFSLLCFLYHLTYFTILNVLSRSLVGDLPFILQVTNE